MVLPVLFIDLACFCGMCVSFNDFDGKHHMVFDHFWYVNTCILHGKPAGPLVPSEREEAIFHGTCPLERRCPPGRTDLVVPSSPPASLLPELHGPLLFLKPRPSSDMKKRSMARTVSVGQRPSESGTLTSGSQPLRSVLPSGHWTCF